MPLLKSIKATISGGSSLRVTLPRSWCQLYKLNKNTELQLIEHGVIVIFPPNVKDIDAEKLVADIKGTLAFLKN
jgi:hypothetical protein